MSITIIISWFAVINNRIIIFILKIKWNCSGTEPEWVGVRSSWDKERTHGHTENKKVRSRDATVENSTGRKVTTYKEGKEVVDQGQRFRLKAWLLKNDDGNIASSNWWLMAEDRLSWHQWEWKSDLQWTENYYTTGLCDISVNRKHIMTMLQQQRIYTHTYTVLTGIFQVNLD